MAGKEKHRGSEEQARSQQLSKLRGQLFGGRVLRQLIRLVFALARDKAENIQTVDVSLLSGTDGLILVKSPEAGSFVLSEAGLEDVASGAPDSNQMQADMETCLPSEAWKPTPTHRVNLAPDLFLKAVWQIFSNDYDHGSPLTKSAEPVVLDGFGIAGRLPEGYVAPSKKLAKSNRMVVHTPSTDIMNTDDFAKQFAEVAPYLNEKHLAAILEKARHDARIGQFLAKLNESPNRPRLRKEAPTEWDLPTFLSREWWGKGWIMPDIDLQMVEAYDPGLPRDIGMWESRNGLLPPELRFKKVRKKPSAAERLAATRKLE